MAKQDLGEILETTEDANRPGDRFLLAIEIERPVEEATVKTVRIVNGEAGRGPKRATVFDAE